MKSRVPLKYFFIHNNNINKASQNAIAMIQGDNKHLTSSEETIR